MKIIPTSDNGVRGDVETIRTESQTPPLFFSSDYKRSRTS